jgi:hypothetical protein
MKIGVDEARREQLGVIVRHTGGGEQGGSELRQLRRCDDSCGRLAI